MSYAPEASQPTRKADSPLFTVILACLIVMCWLICTIAQVEKYLPRSLAMVVCAVGCAGVVALLMWLRRRYRAGTDVGMWTLVAAFGLLALSFAVLYPKSLHHAPGKGSDREDALRVELVAVTHHQYPYDARDFLHAPPTPLPGAMWLAAPFFFAGRVAFQNLVWAGIFIFVLTRFFRMRLTALSFMLLFLVTALENLNDFDVGGDYVTNIMYIAVALFAFSEVVPGTSGLVKTLLAVVLLGVAISSRVIYVVVVPPILALAWQRGGPKRALSLNAGVLLTAVAVSMPIFCPHPLHRFLIQLNQNADKLAQLPKFLSGPVLPALALALACTGFFLRMTLRRVYLLVGSASLVLLLPPMVTMVNGTGGFRKPLPTVLEYLAVSAIFLSLWAFARWEDVDLQSEDIDRV